MKNLLFITFSIFLVFIHKQSFSQIVTPDSKSKFCPGETVEYTINASYYGEQTYMVLNGVFIVPDSMYYTAGDSTGIIFTANTSNNKIKIRWGHGSNIGTLRWFDQFTSFIDQDFEIGIVHPPSFALGEGDKVILNGNNIFFVNKNFDLENIDLFHRYGVRFGKIDTYNNTILHSQAAELLRNAITKKDVLSLTNGPGKLCQAFEINRSHNGEDLMGDKIYLLNAPKIRQENIVQTKRIGIKKSVDLPWRFYIKDNHFVSKK